MKYFKYIVIAAIILVGIFLFMQKQPNPPTNLGFQETDPSGTYKISFFQISDDPSDIGLKILNQKTGEGIMTIPPEMLIARIGLFDSTLTLEEKISLARHAFEEDNLGPWSKDGKILWGKLLNTDSSIFGYYKIDIVNKNVSIESSTH